jgi:hypothetical protein
METMRLSAFRFLFLMRGEASVADRNKAGTTPSFSIARLFFALQSWRCLHDSGANALRERECASSARMKNGAHVMKRRLDLVMTHDADRIVGRSSFAVALATLHAAPKRKAKLPRLDAAARFAIEKALQQRRYCNAFALWRTCRNKLCRREGTCCGDADACLKLGLARIPHDVQWRVRQAILDATPYNFGTPERQARQCMPMDLYSKNENLPPRRGGTDC